MFIFENTHPAVIAFAADRSDLAFWVLGDPFVSFPHFDAEGSEVCAYESILPKDVLCYPLDCRKTGS